MQYKVEMLTPNGKTIVEVIDASSEIGLINLVKEKGNYLVSYDSDLKAETSSNSKKLGLKSLTVFSYQLSSMLSAGISLLEALKMVQNKAKNNKERKIYRNLYELVQTGNSLSAAMEAQSGAFDTMLISMVKSGEASGSLAEALDTMSKQYDRDQKLNNKIQSASIYPMILLLVSIVVVLILVVFVLPGITSSFPSENIPVTTRILLAFSNFLLNYWHVIIVVILLLIGIFIYMLNKKASRIILHRYLLYIPVIGKLLGTVYSARCARSFASMYSHGVSTLDMIELTGGIVGNAYLEERFNQVYIEVSKGGLISSAISKIDELDTMLSSMISVGEETGQLDLILGKTANYFDEESQAAITKLVSLIEPIMMVVMGLMIGFIVISIIQPIFTMYNSIN